MSGTPLSPDEFRTLELVCDALLPPDTSDWRASVPVRASAMLGRLPNVQDLAQLRQLLALLEIAPANLALVGRAKKFSGMTRDEREAYLLVLALHPLGLLRKGFQALKRLAALMYYADSDANGHNPTWAALNYPGPLAPSPDVLKTIHPLSIERDTSLDCDIVIVGSGAGGGVVAGELAAAGHDVVVLEKGGYYNEADYNQREVESLQKLYLDNGLRASDDLGVIILAGSCLGGGTVVNYTTSFRTPGAIREEWARRTGLPFFEQEEFTHSLDAVCERLGVNRTHDRPGVRDQLMRRGLQANHWHVHAMPRNVDGCTQDEVCGYCGFGCVRGAKRSTLKTYLQDAFDHGARLVVNCAAERVLIENGRAVGVRASTREGRAVTVRARIVVVAAGAIYSPALLLRSGLRGWVGHNLRLHPATGVFGTFEQEVRPWGGTLQALYSDEFADLREGYGVKFETAPLHPGLFAIAGTWSGAREFDARIRNLAHISFIGILTRDRFGGRVTIDRDGVPVVHYRVSHYDRRHIRRGVEAAARVLIEAGAREIASVQNRAVNFVPGGPERLGDWMARVDRAGYGPNQTTYVSFHQMGTCRMGSERAKSVVNGEGETHAVKNLFVADGSLFPTASGVNPMLTISALAHYVARHIHARL